MNREFEALEILKNRALSDLDNIPKTAISICEKSNEEVMKTYETLKQALLKSQEQKNENKVLKACIKDWEDDYEHLKFASEKKEKAFEIIKKKLVNVVDLYQCTDLYTYNSLVKGTFFAGVSRELIQEEFDLLIEVLEE